MRKPCSRAANAARFFPLVLLAACSPEQPADALPRLNLGGGPVAVAGISSGAYMATQAHVAFSRRIDGAALVAGGPYGCAGGALETALSICMKAAPQAPDADALAALVRTRASRGLVDPVEGLAGDKVWVLHGRGDQVVEERVSQSAAALYERLGEGDAAVRVSWDGERDFAHLLPTESAGVACDQTATPYLGACGFDAAGMAFAALFGPPPRAATAAQGELRAFDQNAYASEGVDPLLAERGYLYLPAACAAGEDCGLLVVFHGCEQNADSVGEAFVRDAGFNRWADVYRMAVLYPQTRASFAPLNPKACWDWWGYSGADYDTRNGAQLRWLAKAAEALGAPLE